jgi:hypothetical protein
MNRKTFIITLLSAIAAAFTGKSFLKKGAIIVSNGGEFRCAKLQEKFPEHLVVGVPDPTLRSSEQLRELLGKYKDLPIWFDEYRSHGAERELQQQLSWSNEP